MQPEDEPVVVPVSDIIDLHSFLPRDIPAVVEEYLIEAYSKGFRQVRIIHGRGIGLQRQRVRAILERTAFVESFSDAPLEAGGWGSTVVTFHD